MDARIAQVESRPNVRAGAFSVAPHIVIESHTIQISCERTASVELSSQHGTPDPSDDFKSQESKMVLVCLGLEAC